MIAPMARRHSAVASISRLVCSHRIRVGASARAAQISWRCAADLEAMAKTVPCGEKREMVTFIMPEVPPG